MTKGANSPYSLRGTSPSSTNPHYSENVLTRCPLPPYSGGCPVPMPAGESTRAMGRGSLLAGGTWFLDLRRCFFTGRLALGSWSCSGPSCIADADDAPGVASTASGGSVCPWSSCCWACQLAVQRCCNVSRRPPEDARASSSVARLWRASGVARRPARSSTSAFRVTHVLAASALRTSGPSSLLGLHGNSSVTAAIAKKEGGGGVFRLEAECARMSPNCSS